MTNGLLVRVKVEAGARKEKFEETKENVFEIAVKEKAERNEANKRVRTVIARQYRVPIARVSIVAGHTRKNKTLKVVQ